MIECNNQQQRQVKVSERVLVLEMRDDESEVLSRDFGQDLPLEGYGPR